MTIISLPFIGFVALLVGLYFLVPKKHQWVILLLASVAFYLTGGLKSCVYILVTVVTQFYLALALERKNAEMKERQSEKGLTGAQKREIKQQFAKQKRLYVALSVIVNLGILIVLKYTNVTIEAVNRLFGTHAGTVNILIPIGLSYYTFKSIGYVIDVNRGRIPAQRNILKLALYIGYFPALIQGPIDRYEDLAEQLYAGHDFSYQRLCFGAQRMLWGYIKKLVIAERASVLVDTILSSYEGSGHVGFMTFFALALSIVRLYADFSSGMDIVIGLSEIFGIKLTENFERPFYATSVAEYWQRWHITLGAWMRTYVFYPISLSPAFSKMGKRCRKAFGDRVGKLIAPSVASFITFVLIGTWHGVGMKYVLYGLYMAVFVATNSLLEDVYAKGRARFGIDAEAKSWRIFQRVRTFFIITMSRYVNMAKDVPDIGRLFKATFTHFNPWVFFDGTFYTLGLDRPNFWLLMVGIAALLAVDFVQEKGVHIRETIAKQRTGVRWAVYYAAIFALVVFGMYGPGYNAASFIYQRF